VVLMSNVRGNASGEGRGDEDTTATTGPTALVRRGDVLGGRRKFCPIDGALADIQASVGGLGAL
jgi:hypothetical protein